MSEENHFHSISIEKEDEEMSDILDPFITSDDHLEEINVKVSNDEDECSSFGLRPMKGEMMIPFSMSNQSSIYMKKEEPDEERFSLNQERFSLHEDSEPSFSSFSRFSPKNMKLEDELDVEHANQEEECFIEAKKPRKRKRILKIKYIIEQSSSDQGGKCHECMKKRPWEDCAEAKSSNKYNDKIELLSSCLKKLESYLYKEKSLKYED